MKRTSVDALVARRFGLEPLTTDVLQRAQMNAAKQLVRYCIAHSSFYRECFSHLNPDNLNSFADLQTLPFLTSQDIKDEGHRLLCVSQSRVERVVTMQTSGSTGLPKRYSFSANDIRATSEFFYHGMQSLIGKGDRVLVWLPYELPDSVGQILIAALEKNGIYAVGMWPPCYGQQIHALLIAQNITCIVGLPQHLLALSEAVDCCQIQSMLLCSDYAAPHLRMRIEANCGCETFLHYGATESGLGGGVECSAHVGCHLRESDLLVEIVDPETGQQLGDGESGEVVLTTLGREAMPLIRYRTGDIAVIDRSICSCGGVTSRLLNIRGRLNGCELGDEERVYSQELDDCLFQVPGLLDYRATVDTDDVDRLHIEYLATPDAVHIADRMLKQLATVPAIHKSLKFGTLAFGKIEQVESFSATHTLKRTILDNRVILKILEKHEKRIEEATHATCS